MTQPTDRRARSPRGRAPEPPLTGSAAEDAEPDPESIARTIVLRQLTAAPRSRAQLEEAMLRRAVPADVSARVLDRFEEVGLVDDASYAESFVRSRQGERGLARRALERELRARGIAPEVAEEALAGIDGDDERAAALALVRRRAPATAGLERTRRRRRLVAMLARKGYPSGVALAVVDEVLAPDDDRGAVEGWPDRFGDG